MKSKLALYVSFSLLFLSSCSKFDKTYTIEMKDGVRHVHNLAPAWGDEPKVELELVQKIGDVDAEDENYQFYKIGDVTEDSDRNIYILDAGNYRIQKFDKNGKYLATIGRRGEGPGEFLSPRRIKIDSENNIYVYQLANHEISIFSPDGKEIKRIRMPYHSWDFFLLQSDNFVLFKDPREIRDNIEEVHLVNIIDKYGNVVKKFGKLRDLGVGRYNYTANMYEMAQDINENIFLTFQYQNRIEKYSPEGELLFRVDRPLKVKLSYDIVEIAPEHWWLEATYVSNKIDVDYKSRIWVNTYKKQKEEGDEPSDYLEFDVFDENGILLGKVPVPHAGRSIIKKDHIYFIGSKEEVCVFEYKIVEK